MEPTDTATLASLIDAIDSVVDDPDCSESTCGAVKDLLEKNIGEKSNFLAAEDLESSPEHYARHLIHSDPAGRYSVIAMVWEPGQGTPIHDHGGLWVVECVYSGKIRVRSFDPIGDKDAEIMRFGEAESIIAGCGPAGHLIPPRDYHVIENPVEKTAVTLHVYGGNMDHCRVYTPRGDGSFTREHRNLTLD